LYETPYQISEAYEKQLKISASFFVLLVKENYSEQSFQDRCLQNIVYGRTHTFWEVLKLVSGHVVTIGHGIWRRRYEL
jgi:hypothetical protein